MAPSKPPTITILGSLNIDFITLTPRLPSPGETLSATSFTTGFGGKGANQAVACARLSQKDYRVRMVGKVGDDAFGSDYKQALIKEGMDVEGMQTVKGSATGVTNIVVEEGSGENRILYVANANAKYEEKEELIDAESGEVVVMQLEIPLETVLHNLQTASSLNLHTILNPAPAILLPDSAYPHISTLIMNETESCILSSTPDPDLVTCLPSLLSLARSFLARGVKDAVVITLGGKGLVYATAAGEEGHIEAEKVKVVDTTAAGDTFVGGYAVERARVLAKGGEWEIEKALRFATKAAARTVERSGAMSAIPHLSELL